MGPLEEERDDLGREGLGIRDGSPPLTLVSPLYNCLLTGVVI
ncbi:hypothetical protein KSX_56240 [Ktedonospora formicarum]|uniref:Uncharacterized protein n=1 Tax=Ktedonospora formicarum TaxID=2778364 RepID=A0A8J3I4Q8_9CHLR|nr:hypothetical protein KSX_56240 [Ktedonospora formicarum]